MTRVKEHSWHFNQNEILHCQVAKIAVVFKTLWVDLKQYVSLGALITAHIKSFLGIRRRIFGV